jgi:YHS domain-containing protein
MKTLINISRRNIIASTAVLMVAAMVSISMPLTANAYDEQSTSALNVDSNGIALQGYDPVSYFTPGGPKLGTSNFINVNEGTTYRFANADNRDAFKKNPENYKPAFGGFCAMGVVFGKKLDVNPQLWRVVDGKLYLNVHKEAQARWLEDVPGNINKANLNWLNIRDLTPAAL